MIKAHYETPKNRMLKRACVAALLSMAPVYSWAGSNSFSSLPAGSSVVGTAYCACSAINGPFATTIDLGMLESNLASAILADGKLWGQAQTQQMEASLKERNQYLQEETNLLNQNAAAHQAERIQSQIAPVNVPITLPNGTKTDISTNQASASCGAQAQRSAALGAGLADNAVLATNLSTAIAQYNVSNKSNQETLASLASAPPQTLSASSLFPTAATASAYPTPEQAAQTIAHMTNPTPPAQLATYQAQTSSGVQWKAMQNAVNTKMSMAQNAMAQIAAWHQPTISASTFVAQWNAMYTAASQNGSASAPPPAPGVNASGNISPDGALDLAIDARYANPKWYAQVALQQPAGLLKDINEMGAIGLRVHYESMVTSEYLAGVSAEEYAHMAVTPAVQQINQLAGAAMRQEANASTTMTPSGAAQ